MAHLIDTMAYTGLDSWAWPRQYPAPTTISGYLAASCRDGFGPSSRVTMFNVASDALHIRPPFESKVLYRLIPWSPLSVVSALLRWCWCPTRCCIYQDLSRQAASSWRPPVHLGGGCKLWALAKQVRTCGPRAAGMWSTSTHWAGHRQRWHPLHHCTVHLPAGGSATTPPNGATG